VVHVVWHSVETLAAGAGRVVGGSLGAAPARRHLLSLLRR